MKKHGGRPHWAKVPTAPLPWEERVCGRGSLPLLYRGSSWEGRFAVEWGSEKGPHIRRVPEGDRCLEEIIES